MADVHLWPYGNAHEVAGPEDTWKYTCQHGPNECVGNMLEACALYYIKDPLQQQQFFVCLEKKAHDSSREPKWDNYA